MPTARPTGVTILAVLNGIAGAFALIGGLGLMVGGGAIGAMMGTDGGMFAALGAALGFMFLIMGVLYLAAAWGLWTQKRWAWYVAMVGVVLGILGGIANFPMGILQLALAVFVGWYLLNPPIQRWFGVWYNVPWNKTA